MQQLHDKKKNMQRKQEVENSEVHLLPVFALPPRGGEDEKNSRGKKGEKLMPITTNIWKKVTEQGKPGQPLGSETQEPDHHQSVIRWTVQMASLCHIQFFKC